MKNKKISPKPVQELDLFKSREGYNLGPHMFCYKVSKMPESGDTE